LITIINCRAAKLSVIVVISDDSKHEVNTVVNVLELLVQFTEWWTSFIAFHTVLLQLCMTSLQHCHLWKIYSLVSTNLENCASHVSWNLALFIFVS